MRNVIQSIALAVLASLGLSMNAMALLPPPLEENELVPALQSGDAETALRHTQQAWRLMDDPAGMPPLYYVLTPEMQNRLSPEEQDTLVDALIDAHGLYYENRAIFLTHLAAYGSADRFIQEALEVADILEHQGRELKSELFFLTTVQRQQDRWTRFGPTADSCPLVMHAYYSYMGAPSGSVQMLEAERKFAFLIHPYLGSQIFNPEAEAFIREQGIPADTGDFAARLARAVERHEMDVVQPYIDDEMPFIEQMRRMTTDTERWAERADTEESIMDHNVGLRRARRPGGNLEPEHWSYHNDFRADFRVECSIQTRSVPFMTGYDLDIARGHDPIPNPSLYGELARASLDSRYAPRAQRLVEIMQEVGRFHQRSYDFQLEGWRNTYRQVAEYEDYLLRLSDIERREREFYASQAREANEPSLLEKFFGGVTAGLDALAQGMADAQVNRGNDGASGGNLWQPYLGHSSGNYSSPANYQTGISGANGSSNSRSSGMQCDLDCTGLSDAACDRVWAAYEQCLSAHNTRVGAIFTQTYGRASGDRTGIAAPN